MSAAESPALNADTPAFIVCLRGEFGAEFRIECELMVIVSDCLAFTSADKVVASFPVDQVACAFREDAATDVTTWGEGPPRSGSRTPRSDASTYRSPSEGSPSDE